MLHAAEPPVTLLAPEAISEAHDAILEEIRAAYPSFLSKQERNILQNFVVKRESITDEVVRKVMFCIKGAELRNERLGEALRMKLITPKEFDKLNEHLKSIPITSFTSFKEIEKMILKAIENEIGTLRLHEGLLGRLIA